MNKPQEVLQEELKSAAQKVKVGSLYCHYKKQDLYKVVDLAITEHDSKVCVIYQAQYGEQIIFVRAFDSWLDIVELQGKYLNRFTLQA